MSDNEKLAAELTTALRTIADAIDGCPEVAPVFCGAFDKVLAYIGYTVEDKPAALAMFARVAAKNGATVTKEYTEDYGKVHATWGPVSIQAYTSREEVCERVQVGEETVTRTVPDPTVEVPTVDVTETVPVYEWRCAPLLAAEDGAA